MVTWDGRVNLSYPKKQGNVKNLEELFNAIAPDTEIILDSGNHSFADLDVSKINNPYVYVDYDVFDTDVGEWGTGQSIKLSFKMSVTGGSRLLAYASPPRGPMPMFGTFKIAAGCPWRGESPSTTWNQAIALVTAWSWRIAGTIFSAAL